MREKLAAHLSLVRQCRPYVDFVADDASGGFVGNVLKEVMLEIFWYAPRITEAVFLAVGRMPKERPELMKQVAQMAIVEANHFQMAYRDYEALGGDIERANGSRVSPASFALGAVCQQLAAREDPFSILGAMYAVEGIAPELNTTAQQVIAAKLRQSASGGLASEFVASHAEEDVAHTRYMEKIMTEVVAAFPGSASAISYGVDCFSLVYPLPIWLGAAERAKQADGPRT